MESVGLIGVGLLGSAVASRLIESGHPVLGYDLDPARCLGAATAQQVASSCRRIVLSLPTSDVSAVVVDALDLPAGAIVIDTTTGDPKPWKRKARASPPAASSIWTPPSAVRAAWSGRAPPS